MHLTTDKQVEINARAQDRVGKVARAVLLKNVPRLSPAQVRTLAARPDLASKFIEQIRQSGIPLADVPLVVDAMVKAATVPTAGA